MLDTDVIKPLIKSIITFSLPPSLRHCLCINEHFFYRVLGQLRNLNLCIDPVNNKKQTQALCYILM